MNQIKKLNLALLCLLLVSSNTHRAMQESQPEETKSTQKTAFTHNPMQWMREKIQSAKDFIRKQVLRLKNTQEEAAHINLSNSYLEKHAPKTANIQAKKAFQEKVLTISSRYSQNENNHITRPESVEIFPSKKPITGEQLTQEQTKKLIEPEKVLDSIIIKELEQKIKSKREEATNLLLNTKGLHEYIKYQETVNNPKNEIFFEKGKTSTIFTQNLQSFLQENKTNIETVSKAYETYKKTVAEKASFEAELIKTKNKRSER